MKKLLLPIIAILIFISESLFVNLFSGELFNSERIFVPRFLIIFLVFLAVYGTYKLAILYALMIGLVFDVVYTEILGIYLFVFPVLIYLIAKLAKILQNHLFIVSILSLLAISLLEVAVYQINLIIGFADMTYKEFVLIRLLPTLVLNAAAVIILSYPLKKRLLSMNLDGRDD